MNEWNLGEKDKKGLKKKWEKAVLVGLVHQTQTEEQLEEFLDELAFLAMTAGAESVKRFTQKLPHPDRRTFIGSGKVEEIRQYIEALS